MFICCRIFYLVLFVGRKDSDPPHIAGSVVITCRSIFDYYYHDRIEERDCHMGENCKIDARGITRGESSKRCS